MKKIFLAGLAALNLTPLVALGQSIQFQISTKDRQTLTGQIDLPNCSMTAYPAVFFVSGTGFFTRNAFFGNSRTERDLLFKDLSRRLVQQCIATVRFDSRGVICDLRSKPDIGKCVDQKVRAG
jgi:hypothetical protein